MANTITQLKIGSTTYDIAPHETENFSISITDGGSSAKSLSHGNTYTINAGGSSCSFKLPTASQSTSTTSEDKKVQQTNFSDKGTTTYPVLISHYTVPTSGASGYAAYVPTVTVNGNGELTAPSFCATSDKRLKDNIKEFIPQKSILDLPIVEFDFKDSGLHQIGCIAQDLQEICPEIVNTNDSGYLSINENKIVYLLLNEVKKLKAEVEALKRGD